MAESTPRSRTRATSGQRRRSTRSRSAAAGRAASTRSRRTAARRSPASRSSSNGSSASNGAGALGSVTDTVGSAATKARGPLIAGGAAVVGAVGGIVLGARVLRPRRKVLGIPIARDGIGLKPLAKEVRKAGRQLERMVDEVGKAREQAQKVGKALS